jgi:Ni/Fe-hydrogenase 1 B-type cytochrome subunit
VATNRKELFPVYVYELPVRIWHWVMAPCMVVLFVTGYLIGSPPPTVGGEAADSFSFGYIRFAHFAAAYILIVSFLARLAWAFVGNTFSREIFVMPLLLLKPAWWAGLFDQARYYLFLKRNPRPWQGHNPIAMAAMFFMYVLGTAFMMVTGLALYGEGLGMQSWAFKLFSSWALPLFGYSMNVHTLHHLGMWYLAVFTIVHIYMAIREDICSGHTMMSTMINGWRVTKS